MDWHFYRYLNHRAGTGTFPVIIANDNYGYLISEEGFEKGGKRAYFSVPSIKKEYYNEYKVAQLKDILKLFVNETARNKFCNDYKINLFEPDFILTDKLKNKVLKYLRKCRAFNGDSAYKFNIIEKEFEMALHKMAQENLIKTKDYEKFWIEC